MQKEKSVSEHPIGQSNNQYTNPTNQQRIEFIDLAKGICILLVVIYHIFGFTGAIAGKYIGITNIFRMPLYFVLSGLFFKTYGGILPFFKKKTNKLLIPFICSYIFVVLPVSYLLQRNIGGGDFMFFIEKGRLDLGINGSSWFLLCLFIVNMYFYLMFLLCRNHIWWIAVGTCVCGIVGYSLNLYGFYLPVWMDTSLTVMPFFLMGYAMRKYSNVLYGHFTKKSLWYLLASLAVLLLVYYTNESMQKGAIVFVNNKFNVGLLSVYLGGFAGTCCVLMIAKFFKRLPMLSYIGRFSIVVLLTHPIYMFILREAFGLMKIEQSSYTNIATFAVIVALALPTIKFCIKFLPYCFAQKDLWK